MYELTNHLGNVMVTISDENTGIPLATDSSLIDHYTAQMNSSTDYYPFGMQMPARNWNSSYYRYGFNGKENDNEVKGIGNQIDYGMRVYDPRLGRFLSVDPLSKKYPGLTPYQFASNSPLVNVDLDGLEGSWYGWTNGMTPQQSNDATMELTREQTKVVVGTATGIKKSVVKTWNFITSDAWKAQTWVNTGKFLEEGIIGMSAVPIAPTPRVDAAVKNMNDNLIHGDARSRSEYLAEGATDFLTYYAAGEAIGSVKSLVVAKYMSGTFKIGSKTLATIIKHLEQFGVQAENSVMLERMQKIVSGKMKATEIDINFAKHEFIESELMKNGMTYDEAHHATLKEQGMGNMRVDVYEKKLYTQEALNAGNAEWEKEVKKK